MEPDYDDLSELSVPTREGYMGYLPPIYIMRYQKGFDTPRLATIEELTKEAPWGENWKIRVLEKD